MRTVLPAAELGPSYWPYASMYIADVMRHNSTGRLWNHLVCMWRTGGSEPGNPEAKWATTSIPNQGQQ
eukprot:9916758-Prorocentrum_lima.AAC.1